jgi:outer membrane receptor protein involved in Fe transport
VGLTIGGQRKLRNTDYGFLFQDNWRVSRRLQINAGLRYEYFSPFSGGWNPPAAQGRYGNLGFDALRGPARFGFDFALHKMFSIAERHKFTFRAETFNLLNHPIFNLPVNRVSSPTFGFITRSLTA